MTNRMAVFCRILVAATLVVHVTIGCCAHHAHGCEDGLSAAHSDATHGGQELASTCDHSDHGTNDCKGERCSFVSSSSRTVDDSLVLPLHGICTAVLDDQSPLVGIDFEQLSACSGRFILPVRLHLAYQVLLI